MSADSIELRRCHGIEEFRACVAMQKEVWNFTDAELVPLRMFVVADKVGGQVMGAFNGNAMVGFALSVPGTRSGHILSALAHAGRAQRSSQWRAWAPPEAHAARRCDRARHRTDRVDFRSPRNQECLSEPRKTGSHRAPLQHQPVWHHVLAACREAAQ